MTSPKADTSRRTGQSKRDDPDTAVGPGLYLVATPIGNLGDITVRALDVLRHADVIACEDSRVTGKLLRHYGISTSLTPYHDHNAARARPALLDTLRGGGSVALVSDAGSPLVSDPGYRLVKEAAGEDVAVTAVPGPSAPVTALQLSGLPTDRFLFCGFLPAKAAARRTALLEVAAVPSTLIFFETAPRLAASLADMAAALGPRPAAVARELTKAFEEVRRDWLAGLAAHYEEAGPPKGEIVVVVGPPAPGAPPAAETVDTALAEAMTRLSTRDAAAEIAASLGLPRRDVYQRALALRDEAKSDDAG